MKNHDSTTVPPASASVQPACGVPCTRASSATIAPSDARAATTVAVSSEGESDSEEEAASANGRYLFVLARLNEGLLAKPVPKPLPELSAESAKAGASDEAAGEGSEPSPEPGGRQDDTQAGDEDKEQDQNQDQNQNQDQDQDQKGDRNGDQDNRAEPEKIAAEVLAQADETEAKAQAALEERRRVERENRLAQEEYDQQLKAAEKRVRDLNNRFADWYYVVSDPEYAKIRLSESDAIQAKPVDEAATAPTFESAP